MDNKAEISVTIDKTTGEQNVNLANVAPDYLAIVFGNAVAQVAKDSYVMGHRDSEQFLLEAVTLFIKHSQAQIDISTGWNDVNIIEPKDEGPFICYSRKNATVYPNMYYDKDNRIFGDERHMGYPNITHWISMPE